MKYVTEYRDAQTTHGLAAEIAARVTRPWRIMEVCGGQTHSIVRFGLEQLLPKTVTLLHGPGCPVCVTPLHFIDDALLLAERKEVILCSFGDMLRVPGSRQSLLQAKARGGDVRVVYSPLDALALAQATPGREIVFFAVGFETTAPANAMAVHLAKMRGVRNFSVLVSHVLVPPALEQLLDESERCFDGLLAAGHVCAIMGLEQYSPLATRFGVPIVATGFEPVDILRGILGCVEQLEAGRAVVENQYRRVVQTAGNAGAQRMLEQVFEVVDRNWRGVGRIVQSGLGLRAEYRDFDAARRFGLGQQLTEEPIECIAGQVLMGKKRPAECPAFGNRCTPESPLGAPMVSSEGACAAYYRYRPPPQTSTTGGDA